MKSFFLAIACALVFGGALHAQNLYLPRDVRAAFEKGTRSADGRPGKNYWQNRGRYNISLNVQPPDRTVRGTETITYINNSPDTIKNPILKLIMNIHKPGVLRYSDASPGYLSDGTTVDAVTANGQPVKFNNPAYHMTWQSFRLPKPLLPHDSVQLTVQWHYQVSTESGREGMIDSTTYFIAYFYPRVAVFDDISGWDRMSFTDSQEFYNDFNDYDLTVNTPKNFIVWATGDLLNAADVLQPVYRERLENSLRSDDNIRVASAAELAARNVTSQNAMNAWHFTANNITDVAIAVSDHYVWDASSVALGKNNERRVSVQAAYNDTAKDFRRMTAYGRHAISWLSRNWPGVDYPFPKTTIVQGYAGMEYPMMVNDESYSDTIFSRFVAEHEIAHTWFPFMMGINEHRYGFMDEGWATTLELLIGTADMGQEKAEGFYKQFRVESWINDPAAEEDIPIITPANILNGPALGNNEYGKASLGYLALKDMLGDDLFRKCLHAYIDRWKGKHPIPWDFFNTFNNISGKNLNWFWNNWYFSNGYIDLAVESVAKTNKGYTLTVNNIGGYVAPVDVKINYSDGSRETLHMNSGVWAADQKRAKLLINTTKVISSLELDGRIWMDARPEDNRWSK